jgi:hypothetical protein
MVRVALCPVVSSQTVVKTVIKLGYYGSRILWAGWTRIPFPERIARPFYSQSGTISSAVLSLRFVERELGAPATVSSCCSFGRLLFA